MFVINCNLQRLDGPVRGNGQIIQELESLFAGAGWNVIKLLWGSRLGSAVRARHAACCCCAPSPRPSTASFRRSAPTTGAYNREHFFNLDPELQPLVAHMTDADIDALSRGGHDLRKLHAAFHAATRTAASRR